MSSHCNKKIKVDESENNIHPEVVWNDEMKSFSNDAHGYDAGMESNENAAQWSDADHSSPQKRTKCAMCGSGDHTTTTCTSSCCLKCGQETVSFQDECAACEDWASEICKTCGEQGHPKSECPNHWRCYHSMIDIASAVENEMMEEPRNFTFKWESTGSVGPGQCYQRFLDDTNSQTGKQSR